MSTENFLRLLCPGEAKWTAKDMSDLTGKVVCVTGGNSGIGWETCKALLEHNAKVILCARNADKSDSAIQSLKEITGKDSIYFVRLDLADLTSCAQAARDVIAKEHRLDILFLNAGVMNVPKGSTTEQGYELTWGVNVVGHFVFLKLLLPLMTETAKTATPDSVRVVFTASELYQFAPKGYINFENVNLPSGSDMNKYAQSKAAMILLATYISHHYADDGVLAFSLNAGIIRSGLVRTSAPIMRLVARLLFAPTPMGAINQLYAGTSEQLKKADSGKYFIPWAREGKVAQALLEQDLADKLWKFLDEDTVGKYS